MFVNTLGLFSKPLLLQFIFKININLNIIINNLMMMIQWVFDFNSSL